MAEQLILTTPLARLSFPSLDKPSKMQGSQGAEKYSGTLLFTPADFTPADVERWKKLKQAVARHMQEKFPNAFDPTTKRLIAGFKNPIRSGMEKPNLPGYGQGVEFLRAASTYKPGMVNVRKLTIPHSELYAGCFVRATVSTWAFDNSGNRGIGLNLHNIMKIADGEAFGGGGIAAENDFGDLSADEMQFDDPAGAIMPGDGDGELII